MECRIGIHLCVGSKGFDGEFTSGSGSGGGVGGMVVGVVATATATAGRIIMIIIVVAMMMLRMLMVRHGNVDRDDDEKMSTKIAGTGGGVERNAG